MTTRATAARVLARLNWTPPNDELAVKYAVAGGHPEKALEYGGDACERLLETALNDNVPLGERWEFILALRDFEPEGLFDILMSVLERNTDGLGHRAAEALGELSDPRALEALLAEAHPSSVIDPELTRSATRAVAKFADGRATRFLLELQKSEDSVGLAVELLGEHLGNHAHSIDSGLLREIATMVEIDQVVMEHDGGWHQKKVDHSLVKELATRELETRATS
jgi:HEAT repeat protein